MEIHEETEAPFRSNHGTSLLRHAGVALVLVGVFVASAAQVEGQDSQPASKVSGALNDRRSAAAKGDVVSELGPSVMYVHHAKSNDYWFGSNDRGCEV